MNHRCPRLKLGLLPSFLLWLVRRCFGRRGPSPPPSSSSTRSTLSPVKEEGAYVAALQWNYRNPLSLPTPVPLPVGKSRWRTSQQRYRPPRRRCGRPLCSDDKRPVISAVLLNPAFPLISLRFTPELLGRRRQTPYQSQPIGSHGVPSDSLRLFLHWRTQNTALSLGASVGWHWEHLWLKGKRTGWRRWGRERGRGPGTDKHFIVPVRSRWGRPNMQHTSW